jgi:hypothetical protein
MFEKIKRFFVEKIKPMFAVSSWPQRLILSCIGAVVLMGVASVCVSSGIVTQGLGMLVFTGVIFVLVHRFKK